MAELLRVALAQYPSGRGCAEIIAEAAEAEAEIVVFPEMYSNGYAPFDPVIRSQERAGVRRRRAWTAILSVGSAGPLRRTGCMSLRRFWRKPNRNR